MTHGWTNPSIEIHGRIFKKRAFVDGTSIKMKYKPAFRSQDYWCRKGYYGMSVQVTCDDNGLLNDINSGIPAGHHDSWVFQRSSLFRKLRSNRFFSERLIILFWIINTIVNNWFLFYLMLLATQRTLCHRFSCDNMLNDKPILWVRRKGISIGNCHLQGL